MINSTNGEAVRAERPTLTKLLKLYELQGAIMNLRDRDTPEAEADEIEAEYHRIIGAIADSKTVCAGTKDVLAALEFVKKEFDGESAMADRLIRAVVEWVRTISFENTMMSLQQTDVRSREAAE